MRRPRFPDEDLRFYGPARCSTCKYLAEEWGWKARCVYEDNVTINRGLTYYGKSPEAQNMFGRCKWYEKVVE